MVFISICTTKISFMLFQYDDGKKAYFPLHMRKGDGNTDFVGTPRKARN